jgi:hypothetical protein
MDLLPVNQYHDAYHEILKSIYVFSNSGMIVSIHNIKTDIELIHTWIRVSRSHNDLPLRILINDMLSKLPVRLRKLHYSPPYLIDYAYIHPKLRKSKFYRFLWELIYLHEIPQVYKPSYVKLFLDRILLIKGCSFIKLPELILESQTSPTSLVVKSLLSRDYFSLQYDILGTVFMMLINCRPADFFIARNQVSFVINWYKIANGSYYEGYKRPILLNFYNLLSTKLRKIWNRTQYANPDSISQLHPKLRKSRMFRLYFTAFINSINPIEEYLLSLSRGVIQFLYDLIIMNNPDISSLSNYLLRNYCGVDIPYRSILEKRYKITILN